MKDDMKVYLASDHAGFSLKEELIKFLEGEGYEATDLGNTTFNPDDDYPDFAIPLAEKIAGEGGMGIVIGRSGNGEAIAANKIRGARAALCLNSDMAKLSREHNDANILSLGADFVGIEEAKEIVKTFLTTEFSSERRHARRLEKIAQYESS